MIRRLLCRLRGHFWLLCDSDLASWRHDRCMKCGLDQYVEYGQQVTP